MDNSFHQQGPETKRFLVSLPIFTNIVKWLAGLIKWTEEEQEAAGIYLDHMGGG